MEGVLHPFKIVITADAAEQLHWLSVREQRLVESAVQTRLTQYPSTPTRAIKRLRPNPLAEFELRAGDLRVLYNVEGDEVVLLVVGRKVGNKLIVKGVEYHVHQDDPTKSSGGGSQGDTQ